MQPPPAGAPHQEPRGLVMATASSSRLQTQVHRTSLFRFLPCIWPCILLNALLNYVSRCKRCPPYFFLDGTRVPIPSLIFHTLPILSRNYHYVPVFANGILDILNKHCSLLRTTLAETFIFAFRLLPGLFDKVSSVFSRFEHAYPRSLFPLRTTQPHSNTFVYDVFTSFLVFLHWL